MEIWEDKVLMVLLTGGHLETGLYNIANIKRAKKCVMKYHCLEDTLFFQNLVVPRPAEWRMLIEKIHEDIGHFGEMPLAEVKKRFFWHDRIEYVKKLVKICEKCQLAMQHGNMTSGIEERKNIPICNLFYHVAMHIASPLLKTIDGNKYLFVVINHHSKWCETQLSRNMMFSLLLSF
jgi:hypothetical protein